MRRVLTIMRREYVETVKTRTFLIGIFMTPVLVGAIILLSGRAEKMVTGPAPAKHIEITDLSKEIEPKLKQLFAEYNEAHPDRRILPTFRNPSAIDEIREEVEADVRSGALAAWLVIPEDALEGKGASQLYMGKAVDLSFTATVENLVNQAAANVRFDRRGLDYDEISGLFRRVPLQQIDVSSKEKRKREPILAMMTPFFFLFLMFMGVVGMNQQMLTSVIEEKNSRVIEVLLSAVSPRQLMAGKILGLGAVGLTVVCLWGSAAYIAATRKGIVGVLDVSSFAYFAVYYVLGFLLFSGVFAAVGAACNSLKEAQTFIMPMTLILIIPMVAWLPISQRPESAFAVCLSFIPPLTPMVMMLRLAATPRVPVLQIVASILVLTLSVILTIRAAAKVFQTGILMYGKPASLREILRWITYKPRSQEAARPAPPSSPSQ